MKPFIRNTVFFIGWLLSPLTFWNDAFINIPFAYICANLFIRVFPTNFLLTVIVFYWISNFAGLLMMYISGKGIARSGKGIIKELILLAAAMLTYSAIMVILGKAGILRPF